MQDKIDHYWYFISSKAFHYILSTKMHREGFYSKRSFTVDPKWPNGPLATANAFICAFHAEMFWSKIMKIHIIYSYIIDIDVTGTCPKTCPD